MGKGKNGCQSHNIPKIVPCTGAKPSKYIVALTPIFTLPQDPATPFTLKITNIFKFGIFAVFLMFHRKGECENRHFR